MTADRVIVFGMLLIGLLAGLCGCSSMQITEDTAQAVGIRYDGVVHTLEDATATAQTACAAHGKTAILRSTEFKAVLERFAHFECVSA